MIIINLVIFLLLVVFCFSLPGYFILDRSKGKFNFWEKLVLATVIGFVLFTLLTYLFLVIKLSFLLFPLIILINTLCFKRVKKVFYELKTSFRIDKITLLVLVIGVIGQLAVIAPSGVFSNGDLIFFSAHGHDGPWHIALMEEIKRGFPLQNPVYSGERLVNYHFFSDLAPAEFNRVFKLSVLDLYFRFFPLLFSLLLGGLSYVLGSRIGNSKAAGVWAMVFTYFAGSFGYFLTLYRSQTIGGESMFWAAQVQSTVGNPPQIAASVIVLAILLLIYFYIKNRDWLIFSTIVLLSGCLIVFKIYGGIVVLAGLGFIGLWELIFKRKLYFLGLFLLSVILSLVLYLPNSAKSTSFLIFEPWWFVRTMIVAPDKLNWLDLELRRQTYIAENNWKRVIQLEATGFLIFFFGNLGMRFLGFLELKNQIKSIRSSFSLILIFTLIFSFVLPMLFLQKGTASNTIQFIQYFLLLMGILAGVSVASILSRVSLPLKIILAVTVFILMVPTQLGLLQEFYNRAPLAKVEAGEIEAMNFIKKNLPENSIFITPPYNKYLRVEGSTPPIWAWSDSAYFSAFSNRRDFLSDTEQVDIMGYDLKKRLEVQKGIYEDLDLETVYSLLKENHIDYMYIPKLESPKVDLSKIRQIENIYQNNKVDIWKVN